jgi:hypothetical protein
MASHPFFNIFILCSCQRSFQESTDLILAANPDYFPCRDGANSQAAALSPWAPQKPVPAATWWQLKRASVAGKEIKKPAK